MPCAFSKLLQPERDLGRVCLGAQLGAHLRTLHLGSQYPSLVAFA